MLALSNIIAFCIASVILIAIPGPSVLYIIARSTEQGRKAGLVSVAGIETGTMVHVCAAAFGLSALLMSSALAFSLLKYAGAIYLIWLGIKKFSEKQASSQVTLRPQESMSRIYWQGAVVNILNPKTALFFFAFLPQFIEPARGHVSLQVFILGSIFASIAWISDTLYALAAGSLSAWLRKNPAYMKIQAYVSGAIYLLLGVLTLFYQPAQKK
ncbi:LysE family translocator [Chitinophaga pendula]|uniref:LysE family translocator n=1 Tax=Chitinophaga TaxID=79328 RepID=UPI000BAE6C7B|nr:MULTISPECIES: LysE family translocator [Chitinophaga]ASZ12955.1 RhtB family transporter [Chitinophaga sp. MD30]UCJ09413.1 LysE family translocator [Chitinophaga pendula]